MPTSLGTRIRIARLRYGMSQAELARRIGISNTAMNQIESGKTPDPAASRIKAIADVLGVSADYLLGRCDADDDEEPAYPRQRAMAVA
jgi:transcriptional regulator with XRE-family HTH domain